MKEKNLVEIIVNINIKEEDLTKAQIKIINSYQYQLYCLGKEMKKSLQDGYIQTIK